MMTLKLLKLLSLKLALLTVMCSKPLVPKMLKNLSAAKLP